MQDPPGDSAVPLKCARHPLDEVLDHPGGNEIPLEGCKTPAGEYAVSFEGSITLPPPPLEMFYL